jgi:hypothetical protein
MSDCLLSGAIIEELGSRKYTGFMTDEVHMTSPSPVGFSYLQFKAVGWGGMASEQSGIKRTYHCPACGHSRYSSLLRADKLFDASQWDGSDIFLIWPLSKFIFATERVARLLIDLRVTGLEILPVEELNIEGDGFTTGRLSYCLPSDRAATIGNPLGIN